MLLEIKFGKVNSFEFDFHEVLLLLIFEFLIGFKVFSQVIPVLLETMNLEFGKMDSFEFGFYEVY